MGTAEGLGLVRHASTTAPQHRQICLFWGAARAGMPVAVLLFPAAGVQGM